MWPLSRSRSSTLRMSKAGNWASCAPRAMFSKSRKTAIVASASAALIASDVSKIALTRQRKLIRGCRAFSFRAIFTETTNLEHGMAQRPKRVDRILDSDDARNRPWHRQHHFYINSCRQITRPRARARPPHRSGPSDVDAHPAPPLALLDYWPNETALGGRRIRGHGQGVDSDRRRIVPNGQEHARNSRE